MLSFAVYGNMLLDATKESDENLVNLLTDSVAVPLGLTDGANDAVFHIDKGTASRYLKGTRQMHQKIMLGTKEKKVINGATEYFRKDIVTLIIPAMKADLIENLSKVISLDVSISEAKKADLMQWANEKTLAEFLANIFLYAVNKPNVLFEEITVHNNLPNKNRYFTGRVNELESIDELFKKKGSAVNICQTVSGLGGIGKTQLAVEYAYRYCEKYKSCLWFINAETATTTYNYFLEFAKHFKISLPSDFKPEDLQNKIKEWLTENKDWLILFDNLESVDVITPYLPYPPEKMNGRLIITTRNTQIDFGKRVELGVFDMDSALLFLKKKLSNNEEELDLELYNNNDDDDFNTVASKLVIRLGFLPLALEQASAYIRIVKCTLAKYMELLTNCGLEAFKDEYAKPENYVKTNDFEKIVNATWSISFNSIAFEGSRQLMNLCAYMAPDKIPVSFFVEMRDKLPMPLQEDIGDDLKRNRIVTDLRNYSLASGDADFINIHRLVQEVVRKSHEVGQNESI